MKPMLATDWEQSRQRYPVFAMPKLDGVRGVNLGGSFTARTLRPFANRYTVDFYSIPEFDGLDGEVCADDHTSPALCRTTTSALNTITGSPFTLWWLFDYVHHAGSYVERYTALHARVQALQASQDAHVRVKAQHLRIVPGVMARDEAELLVHEQAWLDQGYEGVILRAPNAPHKAGRSTVREGGYLRIKRFVEEDAVVLAVIEGQHNANEATVNALGRTERSTHAENMVPNGMVGALRCRVVKTGEEITVAAGSMDHSERLRYFQQQHLIVGATIKFKHFPHGKKDLPRFPTFQAIRMKEDTV